MPLSIGYKIFIFVSQGWIKCYLKNKQSTGPFTGDHIAMPKCEPWDLRFKCEPWDLSSGWSAMIAKCHPRFCH